MRIRLFLLFIFSIAFTEVVAQDRYIVFLEDKANSPFSIENPEEFLSAKAILRREMQEIEVLEEDLPVNPDYVDQIKTSGAEVFFQSKWFNAVLVQGEQGQIAKIGALPFVKNLERVARGLRLSKSSRVEEEEDVEGEESTANAFQNDILGVNVLHQEGYKGEGMLIAFMDSGFEGVNTTAAFEHLFLNDQVLLEKNFVVNSEDVYDSEYRSHGTRVLSTVAAQVEGEYLGIAPNAHFMLFITEDLPTEYRIEEYNFLFAAEMADSAGVDVINTSLGYSFGFNQADMDYTVDQMDGQTTIITQAAEKAFEKGILVVTSVGNEGSNSNWSIMTAPADGPNVLSVGAVGNNEIRASFSSTGPNASGITKPELMALGSPTVVVNNAGNVTSSSGTSFSSPQIAGLAALVWQTEPELTNKELFDELLVLGNRFGNPDNEYGYGIPTFGKLIAGIDSDPIRLVFYPNPVKDYLTIESESRIKSLIVYDLNGRVVTQALNINSETYILDFLNFTSGLYIAETALENGTIDRSRISKQ